LNLAVLLTAAETLEWELGTCALAEHMLSPLLLLYLAIATIPAIAASVRGVYAQGLVSSEFLTKRIPKEILEFGEGAHLQSV
jgi:hypothetical protein